MKSGWLTAQRVIGSTHPASALLLHQCSFGTHVQAGEYIGVTLQIDEDHEVFDPKNSSLHPLFTAS